MKNGTRSSELSRRQFLKLAGPGALALAVLAGCVPVAPQAPAESSAGESGSAPAPPESVTLELLTWGGGTDAAAFEELGGMYKKANPNVTTTVVSVAGGGDEL
ncbi:twin-arginine translocation signal domain-containing protein, partial [candidate division KSB1 bacterium]|nr:twin-arginine translocation signal domain-containing protein [candidate division KSB1 bacterium]